MSSYVSERCKTASLITHDLCNDWSIVQRSYLIEPAPVYVQIKDDNQASLSPNVSENVDDNN